MKLYGNAYQSINPNATVPTLIADYNSGESVTLTQSLSMLDFLEESYPGTLRLIPPVTDMAARTKARDLAALIACDLQPLVSARVLSELKSLGRDTSYWSRVHISKKIRVYENIVEKCAGRFSVGDELSIADICLVPMVHAAALKFDMNLKRSRIPYPNVQRIVRECEKMSVFRVPRGLQKDGSQTSVRPSPTSASPHRSAHSNPPNVQSPDPRPTASRSTPK